ncbi:MAG: DNA-directed RNA polymerase subunit alpha [Candidatus Dojkabacteria bacterium]
MISLKEFTIKTVSETDTLGKFEIGPLPRGYGQTLGNNLRRVLLSSIPGAAITAVKIDGVYHEYSTIDGVSDDVLSLLLSLKNVVVKVKTEEPVTLELNVKGKKGEIVEVKAGDISKNPDAEIINKDYVITTLSSDKAKLSVQMTVSRGVGYALPQESVRQEVGVLPVDSFFSPVRLVKLDVASARVGQQTDLDQINLEVHTNGSVSPSDSLHIAAKIMFEMMENFVAETENLKTGDALTSVPTQSVAKKSSTTNQNQDNPILVEDLNLSTRLTNALLRAGFDDLRKLEGFTEEEISNIRGMGEKSLVELIDTLKKYKIKLI